MINNAFFIEVKGLEELEKSRKWFVAIGLLKKELIINEYDYRHFERYLSELLYILTNWDYYSIGDKTSYLDTKNEFLRFYKLFLEKYEQTNNALLLFGYYKSIFPEVFTNDSSKEKDVIQSGKEMLKNAHINDPNNNLYKCFYLASNNITEDYYICKKALQKEVNLIFPGKTEIELYFTDVINIQ